MELEPINILDVEECKFFLESISGKKPNSRYGKEGSINYYSRYSIKNVDIQQKLEQFILSEYGVTYSLINNHFWVNEATSKSNKNDDYHLDDSHLTIVTFLNDDFTGGEFEYISEDKKIKIKPVKNKSIILTGPIHHRILPVTSGIRHSLVGAFNLPAKKVFSLI